MYEFCVQYKKIEAMLNKDMDTVANNRVLLNSALSKVSGEFNDTATKIKNDAVNKQNAASATSQQTNTNDNTKNENVVYSNVYGSFITEADSAKIGKLNNKDSSGSTSTANTANTVINKSTDDINKDVAATAAGTVAKTLRVDVDNSSAEDADANAEKAKNKIDEYREGSGRYFNACASIIAAKLTVCEAIYKDYMKILRVHVSDYGGSATSSPTDSDGIDSSKVITLKDDNSGETHIFKYDPTVKPIDITKNKVIDGIFRRKNSNAKLLNAYNDKMIDAAKIILNGNLPTIQQVFYLDNQSCVYSGNDGGWVTCNTQKKAIDKAKEKVNDVINNK